MYVNRCHMHFPEINWGVAMNSQWSTHITSLPAPCSALTREFSAHMVSPDVGLTREFSAHMVSPDVGPNHCCRNSIAF